jgi:hypothetical protein
MKIFEASITEQVIDFFKEQCVSLPSHNQANDLIKQFSGIEIFFDSLSEYQDFSKEIQQFQNNKVEDIDRSEYGDFQTNKNLSEQVVKLLIEKNLSPEVIIEPTCGKGNFILASLAYFDSIQEVFGIEIYKPYVWQTKFSILDFFLSNTNLPKPKITILHTSVFDYDFKKLANHLTRRKVLLIGNPPWVTNSKLGTLNSSNLPKKANFKHQNGLDAMTGKSNFDIAEFITIMLLDAFQFLDGALALLVKNSVVKNIVFDQKQKQYAINSLEKFCIDSKKEFDVSVEAALLFCKLNRQPSFECAEYDFYSNILKCNFGWVNSKFVSNIESYTEVQTIDGNCPFEWRQGIKHDCSSIMELEKTEDFFTNKLAEKIELEDDLVYGFLKSSDLKNTIIESTRKFVIVTQHKVGQETTYIELLYPKTHSYLLRHASQFQARKSSIYIGKPQFSIFGIGIYAFKPFKVAISGLYKTYHFTLVLPQNDKPVMLDDTCYFIGFEQLDFAVFALIILNSQFTEAFLKSISFSDAKRVFTKDLLMRIDLFQLSSIVPKSDLILALENFNSRYNMQITLNLWEDFIESLAPEKRLTLFD